MVEPESELRHLARAHSLNHSASHTRRERTHGKHPCPSHGERPPNICSSHSCWPYPAALSPKEHRAGGSSFRVGEGFMTSDMYPLSKGCSSHWVMQVWRSRVKRERDEGRGGDGCSRHAHGCPGHFFKQCGAAARGHWPEARRRHQKAVWVLDVWRCQTEEPGLYWEGERAPCWALRRGAEITLVFEADPGGRVEDEPGGAGCRQDPDQPRES